MAKRMWQSIVRKSHRGRSADFREMTPTKEEGVWHSPCKACSSEILLPLVVSNHVDSQIVSSRFRF